MPLGNEVRYMFIHNSVLKFFCPSTNIFTQFVCQTNNCVYFRLGNLSCKITKLFNNGRVTLIWNEIIYYETFKFVGEFREIIIMRIIV